MNDRARKILTTAITIILPICCMAAGDNASKFNFTASVLSIGNFILLIMAIVVMFQYFVKVTEDHHTFQVVNLVLVALFYWGSLTFLVNHREYYPGFEHLSPGECVEQMFFAPSVYVVKHWIIAFGVILNILYLVGKRPRREEEYGVRQPVE